MTFIKLSWQLLKHSISLNGVSCDYDDKQSTKMKVMKIASCVLISSLIIASYIGISMVSYNMSDFTIKRVIMLVITILYINILSNCVTMTITSIKKDI